MNYALDKYRAMFEKAYQDALRENGLKNLPLAARHFREAAEYSRKLAEFDYYKKEEYSARADKMVRIAEALEKEYQASVPKKAAAPTQRSDSPAVGTSSGVAADPNEDMSSFYTFYNADSLTTGFDGVIGLEEAKDAVTEYVINPIKYPEAYSYSFMDNKCILLEGPPGTGKTTFAKAVAKEISQPFALVNVASLVNCYVGETAKTIDKVFASLRAYAAENNCGVTVFFDEFDEIAKRRDGDDKASQTAVPALLRNLDGIQTNKNFLIIANTNCREMLDQGIQDRFRRKIHIPLPDATMRQRFFRDKLSQLEADYYNKLNFEQLANESDGLSGRSISQICDDYLHFIGAVKAGLKTCDDFNDVLLQMILKR